MPKVWIEISLTTQTHLEQVLRAGCVRTLKHGDRDVWKLEQLQEGKRYTPGATAENESKKRGRPSSARAEDSKNLKKRRKSLLSTRAKKSLTLHPSAVRGALLRRAAELPETVTKIGTLVECVRCTCLEWYHIRPLGECPGEGITKKLAQTRTYIHVCRICNVKES